VPTVFTLYWVAIVAGVVVYTLTGLLG